jgi:hypothetical protein
MEPCTVAADIAGEREMGAYADRRMARHIKKLLRLLSVCTKRVAGRMDATSTTGCAPNRNSCGTTPKREVPPKHTSR